MNDEKDKKRSLGRGLSTLLAETGLESNQSEKVKNVVFVPVESLYPNPDQPRKNFDKTKLDELAESISKNGILQPIITRKVSSDYQIVAGERRWRAAQKAQLHEVPILVYELSDQQVMEYSIIENIQREDLNPVEEALCYSSLIENFDHTQEDLAFALGKSRSYIANILRLLVLPKEVLDLLQNKKLSVGHARVLIGLKDALKTALRIIDNDLSVRQTESLVRRMKSTSKNNNKKNSLQKKDIDTVNLEKNLSAHSKFKIMIEHNKMGYRGKVIFSYKNLDELDKICDFIYSK